MKHPSHWAKSFPMKRFSFNISAFSCNYSFIRKVLKQLYLGICAFVYIIVFLLGSDHSVKKPVMTVETESSNIDDSNQEAEPAQLLDDEGNKNLPVRKTTSCCTGLKVWCLINITTNYCCHMLRNVVWDTTWQITSLLFPLSFLELDTHWRYREKLDLVFDLKKIKIRGLTDLLLNYSQVDPGFGLWREVAASSGKLEAS